MPGFLYQRCTLLFMSSPISSAPSNSSQRLRIFFLLVLLSYVPPFLWQLIVHQHIYQHGYHLLLVLLSSGVATGAAVRSPRLRFFLAASMALNVVILLLDTLGLRFGMHVSLGALTLLVLSILVYYSAWGLTLYRRFLNRHK